MPLMPKRVKYRKQQRGKRRGNAEQHEGNRCSERHDNKGAPTSHPVGHPANERRQNSGPNRIDSEDESELSSRYPEILDEDDSENAERERNERPNTHG